MQVKQKLCGAWRKYGHVLMSTRQDVFVTGSGFVVHGLRQMTDLEIWASFNRKGYTGPIDHAPVMAVRKAAQFLPDLCIVSTPETGSFGYFVRPDAPSFDLPLSRSVA